MIKTLLVAQKKILHRRQEQRRRENQNYALHAHNLLSVTVFRESLTPTRRYPKRKNI
jgi:hypothetical protein